MQDLTVTLVQANVHWENIDQNLSLFDKLLSNTQHADLIILPELFSTGFTMNVSKLAESMNGKTMSWMKDKAKKMSATITGSIIINENKKFFNRLVWMNGDGRYSIYDKRHLFRMAHEHDTYTAGNQRLIETIKGWRICPQICYDLRFPVWNRNRDDYDCLIFTANWPDMRSSAWKLLLQARAVENIAYVIGVNRVGKDGNGIYHSGFSSIINPKGDIIFQEKDTENSFRYVLSHDQLLQFRKQFPAYKDADDFIIDTSVND